MGEKIKIVYIINSFALGGAEKLLLNFCRALDKNKFEIAICTVTGGGPLEEEFEKLGVQIKIFSKKNKLGLGVIWQIKYFLKEFRPQIVHTHLFAADFWGKLAAILAGVPVIITTEHSVNLEEGWLKEQIKRLLSLKTDMTVAVSNAVKDFYVNKVGLNAKKMVVIYNGVDIGKFQFRGFRPIDLAREIKAIIVARLAEVKGHRYLVEAMPLILKKYPNFILNIVGAGNLLDELKKQAEALGVGERIKFLGEILEVETIFPQMDLFILPSLWEGLGVVLLEAQSIGLPVLTSNIPGTVEVVEDGQTGLLFTPKEPQAIFESVSRLLASPKLQEELVNNAHKQVVQKFDLNKMVGSYVNLYLDLMKQRKILL